MSSIEVRWKVYRFECPEPGCGHAAELASHHRRDTDTIGPGFCPTHQQVLEFVGARPLYEADQIRQPDAQEDTA